MKVERPNIQPTLFQTSAKEAPLVVSFGLGVDSVAMLVEMHRRGIRPDIILFADVGNEKRATYAYLAIISAWLESIGFPPVTIVRNPRPRVGDPSLGDALLRCQVLPALAFGQHQCSIVWKINPQDAFLRLHFGWSTKTESWADVPYVRKAIGYDAGPRDRCRAGKSHGKASPGCVNWYPLIEWGIDREGCKAIILAAGLPVPPKSSCIFCPSMQKAEIDDLARSEPDNFCVTIAIEDSARLRGLTSIEGLGRSFSWREYVETEAPADVREVLAQHDIRSDRFKEHLLPARYRRQELQRTYREKRDRQRFDAANFAGWRGIRRMRNVEIGLLLA